MLADIGAGCANPTNIVRYARANIEAGLSYQCQGILWDRTGPRLEVREPAGSLVLVRLVNSQMRTLASLGDCNFNNVERDLQTLVQHIWPVQPFYVKVNLYNQWGVSEKSAYCKYNPCAASARAFDIIYRLPLRRSRTNFAVIMSLPTAGGECIYRTIFVLWRLSGNRTITSRSGDRTVPGNSQT